MTNHVIAALKKEAELLANRYTLALGRAQQLIEEGRKWPGTAATLGHNLGHVAHEMTELAAKIEQTEMILRELGEKE